MAPQTWFITGCSSGFGESFVRQLRANGDNVIATGRDARNKLNHLKDTGATIMDLDVTSQMSAIQAKVDEAWGMFEGGVDVIVNNAGYIASGALEEFTQEDMEAAFRTNFHGPLNITRAFLPKMRARGTGTLLYMGSQAGWHGDASASTYCSTKFALEGAVECLYKELEVMAPALKVLIVEPGYYRTSAFDKLQFVQPRVPDYVPFNAGIKDFLSKVKGNEPGDVDKCVTRMIELVKGTGMAAGKTIPLRVPLGSDGLMRVRDKCQETLKICDEWEEAAKSTDIT